MPLLLKSPLVGVTFVFTITSSSSSSSSVSSYSVSSTSFFSRSSSGVSLSKPTFNWFIVCSCKKIELPNNKIKGRIYSSVSVIFNRVIIFGGARDTVTLNDMWIIDFEDEKNLTVTQVDIDKKIFLPRFGMSTCHQLDSHDANLCRLLVLGGSYFNDDNFSEGVTNELLVFSISVKKGENLLNVDKTMPVVYGFSDKKVFHTAVVYIRCLHNNNGTK